MSFSQRITDLQASPIRKLIPFAQAARNNGIKVYPLNIGQPDIKTPANFIEAISNSNEEVLAYAHSQGLPELLEAFSKYYKKHNMDFESDDLVITNGASEAIYFVFTTLCDAGDEIIIPEPFYTNYNGLAQITGVKLVPITTKAEEGFKLPNKAEILNLFTSKTKAIFINNPTNPTGKVYSKEELDMVKDIVLEKDIFCISDEVYKEFAYDGLKFISMSHYKEIKNKVVQVDSISKRYSACGSRIGCVASKNKELMDNILKMAQSRLSVATLEQIGAASLADVPDTYMEEVRVEYTKRRDVVYNFLQEMEGVVCKKPLGAFYVMAKLPVQNAEDFVKWLLTDFSLNNETVLLTPGEDFYATPDKGKDEIRITYCLNVNDLTKSMNIIKEGLKAYPNKIK